MEARLFSLADLIVSFFNRLCTIWLFPKMEAID